MSNILSKITQTGTTSTGIRVVIAGVEKVGKTTLACSAPRPLHVQLERGFPMKPGPVSFQEVMLLLDEIISSCQKGSFAYKTVVFDSATKLEEFIHDEVISQSTKPMWAKGNKSGITMATAHEGYGKAYDIANQKFAEFLAKCDLLAMYGGINIILTCHAFAGTVKDPAFGEYHQWDLLLHSPKDDKKYGKREMATQWADLIGFLHEPLFINKSKDSDLTMGIAANKGRILGVERIPGYVAGNRFGLQGEITIGKEKGWNYLAEAIYKSCGLDVYNKD